MMCLKMFFAETSGIAAAAAAVLPETDALDAIGRWPLVALLAGTSAWCVYLMFKQSRESSKAAVEMARTNSDTVVKVLADHQQAVDKVVGAIRDMSKEHAESSVRFSEANERVAVKLAERPCMRDPKND